MKKNIQKLMNKKNMPIFAALGLMLTLGVAIGAIFYSNQLTQQMQLEGIDGYVELSIDNPLPSMSFIGDTETTSIKIERMKTNWESQWELVAIWNNTDTGDLLAVQISGTKEVFEMDHTTSIITNALVLVQNGTSVICSIAVFADWSTLITQGDVAYLDIVFTLDIGCSLGNIEFSIIAIDSV